MGRWRAFRAAFGGRFPEIVLSHQVHGNAVRWHRGRTDGWLVLDGFDGHATVELGALLTVTVADCVPVYLASPTTGVVALLHAGWRGTASGVLQRGIRLLCDSAAQASQLVMHCGVGICGLCYEVGDEVRAAVAQTLPAGAPTGPDSSHVDLRNVLARQAHALGVREVSVSSWCSAHDRDRFFSHRASRGEDGRMVAYLGRPYERA
jgi:YfiH family protein